MLETLKERVCQANLELVNLGLVIYTWGNVSGFDREHKQVVIKPSGVDYTAMQPEDMVVLDLNGNKLEGKLKPSSDTPTHLALYRAFGGLGGIVHTHSEWATSWAQARRPIPPYGTTHADYFYGEIPCTRTLTEEEVDQDYELNTGRVIIESFADLDPLAVPGVLVSQHGPFAWGKDPLEAVHHARTLEEIAKMAFRNEALGNMASIDDCLLNKHYQRKHGKDAYYGQEES